VKIDKRYVVGGIMLVPFLPVMIVGFVAFWLYLYAKAGFEIGELGYKWLEEKLN
jgi:hypothetical protein